MLDLRSCAAASDARSVKRLPHPGVLAGLVLAGLCSACAPSLDLSVALDPEAFEPRRVVVEVYADTSCEAVSSAEVPPAPLYTDDVAGGETIAPLPVLPRGRYAAMTTVFDAACRIIARGCVDLDLPTDLGERELRTTALAVPEQACASIASCVDGRCGGDLRIHSCGAPTAAVASSRSSAHVAYVSASDFDVWTPDSAPQPVLPRPDGAIAIGMVLDGSLRLTTCGVFGGGLRCEGPDLANLELNGLGIRGRDADPMTPDIEPVNDWLAVSVSTRAICGIMQRDVPGGGRERGVACVLRRMDEWRVEETFAAVDATAPERPVALDTTGRTACVLTAAGDVTCLAPVDGGAPVPIASHASAIGMGELRPERPGDPLVVPLCIVDSDDGRLRCGVLAEDSMTWDRPLEITPIEIVRPSAFAVRDHQSGCAIVAGELVCWGALEGSRVPPNAFPLDDVVVTPTTVCARSLAGALRCGADGRELECLP